MIKICPHCPLVRSKMRWYFKNPDLTEFTSPLGEQHYTTVRDTLSKLSPKDYELIKTLVLGTDEYLPDYHDNYIKRHLNDMGVSQPEHDRVMRLLWNTDYSIAVALGFIEDYKSYHSGTIHT